MKKFFSPLMAILSIVSPICIVGIMCMIETEIIEAVISGLVLGCMVGSCLLYTSPSPRDS